MDTSFTFSPYFNDPMVKPILGLPNLIETPFLTTNDRDSSIIEDASFILERNIAVKTIRKVPRKRDIMDKDLTFSEILSKKIKFEFPNDRNSKVPLIENEPISHEIYLSKKAVERISKKSDKWTSEEVELLFKGIEAFGTDFSMIGQTFLPGKSRNSIKNRFNLEDKKGNPRFSLCMSPKKERKVIDEKVLKKIAEIENEERIEAEKKAHMDKLMGIIDCT